MEQRNQNDRQKWQSSEDTENIHHVYKKKRKKGGTLSGNDENFGGSTETWQ